jgi:hypothetical protein
MNEKKKLVQAIKRKLEANKDVILTATIIGLTVIVINSKVSHNISVRETKKLRKLMSNGHALIPLSDNAHVVVPIIYDSTVI